jgi:hypothetical protein
MRLIYVTSQLLANPSYVVPHSSRTFTDLVTFPVQKRSLGHFVFLFIGFLIHYMAEGGPRVSQSSLQRSQDFEQLDRVATIPAHLSSQGSSSRTHACFSISAVVLQILRSRPVAAGGQ